MTIIRVENKKDGLGMWQTEEVPIQDIPKLSKLNKRHQGLDRFPNPQQEGLNLDKDNYTWFCAYKTIEQVQQWIKPEEFQILADNNFKIVMLDVPDADVQVGKYQVLFRKETITSSKDITSLFLPHSKQTA